jgi:hypothetical protein
MCLAECLHAQRTKWVRLNNPNYDNRNLTFGIALGLHSSAYKLKYSERFVTQAFDTVYAVEPSWSPGFSLGGLINFKIADFFDLRTTPSFSFYEHKLTYLFTDKTLNDEQVIETVLVELPVLLKYKSERRGNIRMYMIGGVRPGIEASGKKKLEKITTTLEVKNWNLCIDYGFGFDLYYPLFKFSPEIRFSKGIVNVLDNTTNRYGEPLDEVSTNAVNVYFIFQ